LWTSERRRGDRSLIIIRVGDGFDTARRAFKAGRAITAERTRSTARGTGALLPALQPAAVRDEVQAGLRTMRILHELRGLLLAGHLSEPGPCMARCLTEPFMKQLVSLFAVCLSLWAVGTNWTAPGWRWWAHVQFLASDELEGRNVGSTGFDRAATYVAQKFEDAGLRPGGTQGFFQKIDFIELKLDESKSSITLTRNQQRLGGC
jgi:hypothetical protein